MTALFTAQLLVQRYKKASGLHDVAKKTYINYVSVSPGTFNCCNNAVPVCEETVKQWIHEVTQLIRTNGQRASTCLYPLFIHHNTLFSVTSDWKNHYFKLLQLYYSFRCEYMSWVHILS